MTAKSLKWPDTRKPESFPEPTAIIPKPHFIT